ncbi:NAD-dependent DNA ligase LigA [Streptomyces sp. NPDC051572]|uniref:NAD-dependent DNA ligase LigA n=1 Tax=Streptomyces sp. NPDC051572 TaxID=3155802 RepID=UPI00344E707B
MSVTETMISSTAAYRQAVSTIGEASRAYYTTGESPMDDPTFDRLRGQVVAWEESHPEDVAADSPTGKVADGAVAPGDVGHIVPMQSQDKVNTPAKLLAWEASLQRRLGGPVTGGFAVDVKLDGFACAARYESGRLVRMIGRGDGRQGEDWSHASGTVLGLPRQLDRPLTFEVRGEVLFTHRQFELANDVRVQHGAEVFSNARNAAAGTIRARNRAYTLEMTFFGFQAVELPGGEVLSHVSHAELMKWVADAGIQTTDATVPKLQVVSTITEAQKQVEAIAAMRPTLPFDIDGVIIRANSLAEQATAGIGSRHPNHSIAYKLPSLERMSRLLDVVWAVGKTGILAPRAVLEEVEIDGSMVSSATLHSPGDITRLGLRKGDRVTVRKANDIIPQVIGPVTHLRTGDEETIAFPSACPVCGGKVNTDRGRWTCDETENNGGSCGLPAALLYAAGREQLDIDGLGPTVIGNLVEAGMVHDVADLFHLTVQQLTEATRGSGEAANLLEQITVAKSRELDKVLCALGITATGRELSGRLAAHFRSMDAFVAADAVSLTAVEGIGPKKAEQIARQLPRVAEMVKKLAAAGVNLRADLPSGPATGPLVGKVVVVSGAMTGPLATYDRAAMNQLIKEAGGTAGRDVTSKTSLLVIGERAGSKVAKAEKHSVEVMSEETFAILVAQFTS